MNDVLPLARDAVQTVLQHKRLWFLGYFITASASSVLLRFATSNRELSPTVVAVAFVITFVSIGLHVIAEGALITAVRDQRRGEIPVLGRAWRRGLSTAGAVLGLKTITWGAIGAALLAAMSPLLLGISERIPLSASVALTVPLMLAAVPMAISLYLAQEVGLRLVVLEQRRAGDALRAGMRFLRGRLSLALKLLVIDGVARAVSGVIGLPIALFAFGIGFAVYAMAGIVPALIAGGLIMLPVLVVTTSAHGTFRSSLWTHGVLDERPGIA